MRSHASSLLLFTLLGLPLTAATSAREPIRARPVQLAQGYVEMVANALYQHYSLGYPAPALATSLSPQQAGQAQVAFVRRLREDLGPIVGYKVALTSAAAQEQFGVSQPLYGFLLEDMLLESGAELPGDFAALPVAEGDLMVRVGSADINTAETDAELLASLDAVIPFLELPDLVYGEGARLNGGALVAANTGARRGVMGDAIALTPDQDWQTQLGEIRVAMTNTAGQTIGSGDSSALLGHPLNSVRWLRDTLSVQGVQLRPGDLISLGTMTPPVPVDPDSTVTVRYFGLKDDPVEIRVSVEAAD